MPLDPLSDVLSLTRATSVVSGGFEAGGKWALQFPPPGRLKFSAVAKGGCWLRVDGRKKGVRLEAGDVFLMDGKDGFVVGSDLGIAPKDAYKTLGLRDGKLGRVGTGEDCTIVAGNIALDEASGAIVTEVLPPFIHVRGGTPAANELRWIIDRIAAERSAAGPGCDIACAQLAQLLFVQVLRAHLASADTLPPGWLRAMRDPQILRALRLLHASPEQEWKLTDLAKAAAMSRTAFALRFKAVAGVAPLAYLTAWRMRLAQRALRDEDMNVAELATQLGYASESAFSHAFKRETGASPRAFRSAERSHK